MRFNPPPNWPLPPGWTPPPRANRLSGGVAIALVVGVVVVIVAVAMVIAVPVMLRHNASSSSASAPKHTSGTDAIRVTSSRLVTDPQTGQPKVVLSLYEDFLCPFCRRFEESFGPAFNQLIDSGEVAADYYMVAILDRGKRDYSSRAGAAAYCVADQSIDAFRRFHAALYAAQPSELASSFPDNARLIQQAQEAGAGDVAACINDGTYVSLVKSMAEKADIKGTPTVRINGEDYDPSTPDALVARIKQITGG